MECMLTCFERRWTLVWMELDVNFGRLQKERCSGQVTSWRTPEQIAEIGKSADLNTAVLDRVCARIKAGMSTAQLINLYMISHDRTEEFRHRLDRRRGFPKSVCASIDNVACCGFQVRMKSL